MTSRPDKNCSFVRTRSGLTRGGGGIGVGSGTGAGVGSGVGSGDGVGIGVASGVGSGVGGGVGTGVGAGVGGAGVGGSVRTGFAPGKTSTIATRPVTTVARGDGRTAWVRVAESFAVSVAHAPMASARPIARTDMEMRTVRDNEVPPPSQYFDALLFYVRGVLQALLVDVLWGETRRRPFAFDRPY